MVHALSLRRSIALALTMSVLANMLFINAALASVTGQLAPLSDGAYTSWTTSTGASHFTLVDETTCNGTTDYVSTAVVGNKDSYGVSLTSIPDNAKISRIDITPCASNISSGGSGSTLNVFYRFNGADSSAAGAYSLSGVTPVGLTSTAFSGLSFTKTSSSTLQIGAVLSAGSKGARLSRLVATMTYTIPPTVPTITTNAATNISFATTTLQGQGIANNGTTTAWFRYSTSNPGTCDDVFGTRAPLSGGSNLGNGTTSVGFSNTLTSLTSSTTYYYCAIGANSAGTSTGSVVSFTTL